MKFDAFFCCNKLRFFTRCCQGFRLETLTGHGCQQIGDALSAEHGRQWAWRLQPVKNTDEGGFCLVCLMCAEQKERLLARGWYWCDDNCCNLNVEMYRQFAYPVLKGVFETFSPDSCDLRGQHSDSAMGHHMPALNELGLNSANLGPSLSVTEIREQLPNAVIHGQLAPLVFSRNEEVQIVGECLRDFEMAREKKGIVFATAGSVNAGSMLTGLRLIMATIQEHCRYH